jgi:hypothetical protein
MSFSTGFEQAYTYFTSSSLVKSEPNIDLNINNKDRVRIGGHPFGYMDTPLGYRDTPRGYMLYSRQACRLTTYKVAEFIKLIKRFRFLQV